MESTVLTEAPERLNEPATTWSGTLLVGPMVALFSGRGGAASAHAHPAHAVVVGRFRARAGDVRISGQGATALPAGLVHELDAPGAIAIAYLDARWFDVAAAEALARRWDRAATATSAATSLFEDVARLPRRAVDARALRAIDGLARGQSLAEAAGAVGLSGSRLSHLVGECTGAPPRVWRKWLRLRAALDHVGDGRSATTAAYEAGFADSAHLSRSCRAVLGIPPSTLRGATVRRLIPLDPETCAAARPGTSELNLR
ncbi:helix-turn-helix domain-containing protein [Haliangium sp.]|uniref:helix-turn-helix domain-containing protein n=1 Tax=Haliangium sp. TaxID=2663208 RepID=UPI003D13D93B